MSNDPETLPESESDTSPPTLKVEVTKSPETKKEFSIYDDEECLEYDEMKITPEEIKEFEESGNTSTD